MLLMGMGGGAAFTPLSVSGIKMWLAARLETGYADNDAMGTFTDQSGNGNSPTAAAGARPTYKTGVKNGLAVARFNGSANTMSVASASWSQPNTVFLVVESDTTAVNQNAIDGITTRERVQVHGSPDVVSMYAGSDLQSAVTPGAGAWNLLTVTFNGASSEIRRNGAQIKTGNPGANALQGVRLGADTGGAAHFLDGDIAEVIIYNAAVSAGDITLLEAYLNALYAVY